MTIFDDDRPAKRVAHEIGSDLSMLSLEDLDARIALLKAEIDRLEEDKHKKRSGRAAADNLFKR